MSVSCIGALQGSCLKRIQPYRKLLKKKSVVILTGGNFIFGKPPSADLNIFASKLTDSMHLNWRASATLH